MANSGASGQRDEHARYATHHGRKSVRKNKCENGPDTRLFHIGSSDLRATQGVCRIRPHDSSAYSRTHAKERFVGPSVPLWLHSDAVEITIVLGYETAPKCTGQTFRLMLDQCPVSCGQHLLDVTGREEANSVFAQLTRQRRQVVYKWLVELQTVDA